MCVPHDQTLNSTANTFSGEHKGLLLKIVGIDDPKQTEMNANPVRCSPLSTRRAIFGSKLFSMYVSCEFFFPEGVFSREYFLWKAK